MSAAAHFAPLAAACALAWSGGRAAAPSAAPASPPQEERPSVSFEVVPPVWIARGALAIRLTIEHPSPAPAAGPAESRAARKAIAVPASWALGEGFLLRPIAPRAPGAVVDLTPTPLAPGARAAAAGQPDLRIPPGGRLTLSIVVPSPSPPPGDAFDVLFQSSAPDAAADGQRVERVEDLRGATAILETDAGVIALALAPEAAPLATRNFVRLAEAGIYDGVLFHRATRGQSIQAGDPQTRSEKPGELAPGTGGVTFDGRPLPLERSGAAFERGTVALARYTDELYRQSRAAYAAAFGVASEPELDSRLRGLWPSAHALRERREFLESGKSQFFICTAELPQFVGRYSAFAKVVSGMEVVDAIERGEVLGSSAPAPGLEDRPVRPVRIQRARILRAARGAGSAPGPPVPTPPARPPR